jgi:hypothetical protein
MSSVLSAFTLFHVILSLVGIFSGFIVVYGLLTSRRLNGWTSIFLWSTVLTSVTGYFFPFHKLMPSHILGAMSLVTLAITIYARYTRNLAGGWRRTYVITAVLALYFNVFVLIVQLFGKIPALHELAPTQSETPFKTAQLVALLVFLVLGVLAARNFRAEQLSHA